jgi:shikimate kinase
MGSGKTTVGKKLARVLGRRFIDADDELAERTGRSVAEWFTDEGEAGFRVAEAELLAAVLADSEPTVLGAGGGVVVVEANRQRLVQPDVAVVYLHGEPGFLGSRVQRKEHRPLLGDDPREVMAEMYRTRDPWYREVADAVVEVEPAHRAGPKPKWRLAGSVIQELAACGALDQAEVDRLEVVP